MSASVISLGFNVRSPKTIRFAPELPDIGGMRRGVAALIAVAMLIVGVAGWSHTDLPAAAPQTVMSGF